MRMHVCKCVHALLYLYLAAFDLLYVRANLITWKEWTCGRVAGRANAFLFPLDFVWVVPCSNEFKIAGEKGEYLHYVMWI